MALVEQDSGCHGAPVLAQPQPQEMALQGGIVGVLEGGTGVQQQAVVDLAKGDVSSASEKLREANDRLSLATQKLIEEQTTLEKQTKDPLPSRLFPWAIALICLMIIFYFLFSKVPPKNPPPRSQGK